MFHFSEAITNTKGDALIGYYVQITNPATGDVVDIFADENSTPIVSVSGEANKAKVDSDGNASFYIPGGEYNLNIYATDAARLVKTVENKPMVDVNSVANLANTRSDLSALEAEEGMARNLIESGREGLFVFDTSDLSAEVTADPVQGIYVAPDSDDTGASGAWVRKFSGSVNVKWFGATGDGETDDSAAFTSAIAFLKNTAVNLSANGFYKASSKLFIPAGHYYMGTTTIDLTHVIVIEGEGTGYGTSTASKLSWDDETTGIRFQRYNTEDAGTISDPVHTGADGSIIRGVYLLGGYSDTEGEYHGIHAKTQITVEDCLIEQWPGDGIYSNVTAGSGASNEGNSNNSTVSRTTIQTCRNGVFLDGADANVWAFTSVRANSNRAWGFKDSNFLGNAYFSCHTAANGWFQATIPTTCSTSSNRYMVVPGQESAASTNAPTGTSLSNAYWLWLSAGGPNGDLFPDWVSGTTFRSGGSFLSDGANACSVYVGCYGESDQNPCYIGAPAHIYGGQWGVKPVGNALWIRTDTSGTMRIGKETGLAASTLFEINNSNSAGGTAAIGFNGYQGGVKTVNALITSINGGDVRINTTTGSVSLQTASTTRLAASSTGIAVTGSATVTSNLGFATGAGGTVTQATSRTTGVTLNKSCGAITLVSAAGSASWQSFTVTNSAVAATDTIRVVQKSGTDLYMIHVTAVGAGSFQITYATTGGTTTEQPVFSFTVLKAVAA